METASYFVRYIVPIVLSSISVILLSLFNYVCCKAFPARFAEPIEVLAYSVLVAGPIAYALSFIFFFYGIELYRDGSSFARYVFFINLLFMSVGLAADVLWLPKLKL
jgi:hypothetical protein